MIKPPYDIHGKRLGIFYKLKLYNHLSTNTRGGLAVVLDDRCRHKSTGCGLSLPLGVVFTSLIQLLLIRRRRRRRRSRPFGGPHDHDGMLVETLDDILRSKRIFHH